MMTHSRPSTHLLILLLAGAYLLAACSKPAQTAGPPPKQEEKKFNFRLSALWYPSPEKPQELRVDYWIQNLTQENQSLEFSNSGRVCGFIQTPAGKELLRFPEMTAQVVGTETLEARIDRTFMERVPAAALAGLKPARYEVKAWPCGYEEMSAWDEFFVKAPAQ